MAKHRIPTVQEVHGYLSERRNWDRWGNSSSAGAPNLITSEKRRKAAKLVQTGRTISLSRPIPVEPGAENPRPSSHYMTREDRDGWGIYQDYYGAFYHGPATTHLDALCHMWDGSGMWDGRDPDKDVSFDGARYGSVDDWKDGLTTRGVLLDVPKHRGQSYVSVDEPVHGWELEEIAKSEGIILEPGDAVIVYSGREAYARNNGGTWTGAIRPGLHASCLPFFRDHDVSILVWDMLDAQPNEYGIPWTVHGVLFAYGVAIVDNALLEPIAAVCAEEMRYEFMLTLNPLFLVGGTGCPINPVAIF